MKTLFAFLILLLILLTAILSNKSSNTNDKPHQNPNININKHLLHLYPPHINQNPPNETIINKLKQYIIEDN